MIFDNVYKKKILYTLLHSMNGGFILSSHTRAVFSHFHIPSLVLIKKKKKTSLQCFHQLKTMPRCELSLRVNKTLDWKIFFFFFFNIQIPVNQRGLKPRTEANRKSRRLVWKTWIYPPPPQRKTHNTKVFHNGQLTSSGFTTFRVHRQI